MVTKFVKVVIYRQELSFIKLYDPSIKWSCEVTQQIEQLYIHLHKTHGRQIRRGGDLP